MSGGKRKIYQNDYGNVYAQVFDFIFFPVVLIMAFIKGWSTQHFDVKAAFLSRELDLLTFIRHQYDLPNSNNRNAYLMQKQLYVLLAPYFFN